MKNAKGLGKVNDCIEAEVNTDKKTSGTASVRKQQPAAVFFPAPRRVPPGADFQ